jgi:hypothetical protein
MPGYGRVRIQAMPEGPEQNPDLNQHENQQGLGTVNFSADSWTSSADAFHVCSGQPGITLSNMYPQPIRHTVHRAQTAV